jgi:hypothetical protein
MEALIVFESVILPLLGMGMGAFAMFGVYRTINRHLDRRHEKEMAERAGEGSRHLEDLRARVGELEDGLFRIQELEERVDFAERMLAQQRDAPKLGRADNQ